MGDATADMSNKVAVNNQDFLLPLLVRFHQSALKLPEIEGLRTSVQELHKINQREVNEAVVDDEAWACRKLLVHVKRKSQKKLVSLDTQLQNGPLHYVLTFWYPEAHVPELQTTSSADQDWTFQDMRVILRPELEAT